MSNKGQDKGVVVNNVKAGTPAAQIGLKKGDVIVGANQQPVKNIADLRKIFDAKTVRTGAEHSARRRLYLSAVAVTASARFPSPFPRRGQGLFSFCDRPHNSTYLTPGLVQMHNAARR